MKPKYENYLFEYHHNGSRWNLAIPALSEEDALARIERIGNNAQFVGVEMARIPVEMGPLARVTCAVRNWISARK